MAQTLLDDRQIVNRAALSAIGSAANTTLDIVMSDINSLFASATSAATASVLMKRDANANVQVNNLIENITSTVTAAGTTTLTVSSTYFQQFTGTTTQTVVLPNATTLTVGQAFCITNRSTGFVTVNANGGGLIQSLAPGSQAIITVTNISTSAGTWDSAYSIAGSIPYVQTNVITDSTTTGTAATLAAGDILDGVVRLTNASLVSFSGIPAGASGQVITIENQTGNSITVNNNDSGATSANRIYTGTSGAVSMPSNSTFSFVYDTTVSKWMLIGGTGSGSGGGSKNYLSVYTASTSGGVPNIGNGNAELGSTTGWSLGTIGTLTNGLPTGTPTFGSGASGNLSFVVVSSGQLAGTYSFSYTSSAATTVGNMVASNAFFIDTEDQGKVLTYKMYYSVPSNPANGNFSGTSSNSFAIAIWDVTNGVFLPVTGAFGMTQNSGSGYVTGTFQTSINTNQLRYILYNANASSGAITVYLDDISVGPQTAPIGSVITDWVSYTPTIIGFGTPINVSAFYKRVGDSVSILGSFTSGTSTATQAQFSLPPGLSFDTTKINTVAINIDGVGVSNAYGDIIIMQVSGPSVNYFTFGRQGSSNAGTTQLAGNQIASSGQTVVFEIKEVPITGWSSNVQMSNDTDTRVVAASFYNSANTITSTSGTAVQINSFPSVTFDTHGALNSSTGVYTVPVSGIYQVKVKVQFNGGGGSNVTAFIGRLYKNGTPLDDPAVELIAPVQYNSGSPYITGIGTYSLSSGDALTFYALQSTGNSELINVYTVSVNRLSGPSVIAATESVNASYSSSSGQTIPNATATQVSFPTKMYDTHNAMNSSTGVYTIPVSGKYRVTGGYAFTSATWTTGEVANLSLVKNGTNAYSLWRADEISTSTSRFDSGRGSVSISCLAGDTLYLTVYQSTGGTLALLSDGTYNYFMIERIGN